MYEVLCQRVNYKYTINKIYINIYYIKYINENKYEIIRKLKKRRCFN